MKPLKYKLSLYVFWIEISILEFLDKWMSFHHNRCDKYIDKHPEVFK